MSKRSFHSSLPFDRAERVAQQVQHLIATACVEELSDPRVQGVSITRVRMTSDLRIARIYFYMANQDVAVREAARAGLLASAGHFKRLIGREVGLKFMPTIEVFFDDRIDEQERVDELFSRIAHTEKK